MRILLLSILLCAACDVFRAGGPPRTALTREQFVEIYVELARAKTPAARQQVLQKHKTNEKALQDFVTAYAGNLGELSTAFDTALARLAAPSSGQGAAPEPE